VVGVSGIQALIPRPGQWNKASRSDWVDVLATFPFFTGISKRRLRRVVDRATFAEYGPGDVVIQKGESGDSLYVILAGSVKALGKPASRSLHTGDYFGELSLLDGTPRSATMIALGELHVMKLPRQAFLDLAQDPEIALKMLRALGSHIRRLEARPAQA
jgi:CRP/FNR family transcriptional regulator, cyclic AMP receptor protein